MTAFRATFSDMKLVKTRQVAQLIFEIPIEEFDAAYEVLGGMPVPSKERWFGIAAINQGKEARPNPSLSGQHNAQPRQDSPSAPRPDGAKRPWRDLPPQQQAGMHGNDPIFEAFLKEERPDDWHETQEAAECIRLICGVASRAELETNHKARVIWKQLDDQFQAWRALERVGA